MIFNVKQVSYTEDVYIEDILLDIERKFENYLVFQGKFKEVMVVNMNRWRK